METDPETESNVFIETQVAGFLCHIGTGSHGRLRVTETGDIGIKRSVG